MESGCVDRAFPWPMEPRSLDRNPPAHDEQDLVARARAQDQDAFAALVERYEGPLLAVIRPYATDAERARDLVQEATLRAWRSLDRFDSRHRFSTWLFRIGINLAISAGRRASLEARHRDSLRLAGETDDARQVASPLSELLAREDGDRLERAIAALPARQREVLQMRYAEGMRCQDIAEACDMTPNAVSILLFRARKRLKDLLEPNPS